MRYSVDWPALALVGCGRRPARPWPASALRPTTTADGRPAAPTDDHASPDGADATPSAPPRPTPTWSFAAYSDVVDVGRRRCNASLEAFVAAPTEADPRGRQAGLARRPRRLRPDRGVPLLRRPDRQPRRRARGPDQRLADGRGLHRLRRGRPDRRHHQRRRRLPRDHRPTCWSAANEEGGETNISTGWHAIEFLLWGQDLSADGPGARPVTDYTTAAERRAPRHVPHAARPTCWSTTSTRWRDQWDPDAGAYRDEFLADPDQARRPTSSAAWARSAGRAGRRAHRRRLRDQGPGGRALLLLRQHQRRRRRQRPRHPARLPGRLPGRRRPERSSTLVAEVDPELDAACRSSSADSVEPWPRRSPTPFEQLIQGDDDAPGPHRHAGAHRQRSQDQGDADRRGRPTRSGIEINARDLSATSARHRGSLAGAGRSSSSSLVLVGARRGVARRPARRRPPTRPSSARLRAARHGRRRLGADAFAQLPSLAPERRRRAHVRRRQQLLQRQLGRPRRRRPTAATGSGPLFNAQSCSSCHFHDGRGQPPRATPTTPSAACCSGCSVPGAGRHAGRPTRRLRRPAAGPRRSAACPPRADRDHHAPSRPARYADGTPLHAGRAAPTRSSTRRTGRSTADLMISPRIAPPVFGRRACSRPSPRRRSSAAADPDDANGDGISGRPNHGHRRPRPATPCSAASAGRPTCPPSSSRTPARSPATSASRRRCSRPGLHAGAETGLRRGARRRRSRARRRASSSRSPSTRAPSPCRPADAVDDAGQRRRRGSCSPRSAARLPHARAARPARRDLDAARPTRRSAPTPTCCCTTWATGLADGRPDGEATGTEWRTAAAVGHRPDRDRQRPHPLPARRPGPQPRGGHPVARRRGRGRAAAVPRSRHGPTQRPRGVPELAVRPVVPSVRPRVTLRRCGLLLVTALLLLVASAGCSSDAEPGGSNRGPPRGARTGPRCWRAWPTG